MLVEPRQQVQKGALLATLDPRAADLDVRAARASAEAAQGRLTQAKVALDAASEQLKRTQALLDKGLASPNDLTQAQAEHGRAAAALDAVRGERKLAGEQVASAELGKNLGQIRAPIDGVVLRVPDRVGAAVGPEQGPLFVIGQALELMRIDALRLGDRDRAGEARPRGRGDRASAAEPELEGRACCASASSPSARAAWCSTR